MRRLRSLLSLSLVVVLLPLSAGTAEASVRTIGSLALRSTASAQRIIVVRSGRMVALTESEAASTVTPGSLPLDRATEVRLERYLVHDNCPVTAIQEIEDRCSFLLQRQRSLRKTAEGNLRLNQRAQSVIDAVRHGTRTVRRSVATKKGQSTFRTAEKVTGLRKEYEERLGRPRRLQDTSAAFQAAVREGNRRVIPTTETTP